MKRARSPGVVGALPVFVISEWNKINNVKSGDVYLLYNKIIIIFA